MPATQGQRYPPLEWDLILMTVTPLTIADLFLKVGQFLLGRQDIRTKSRREHIDRVATYLEGIAKALSTSADELEQKNLPYSHCSELYFCVIKLKGVLQALVDHDEILLDDELPEVVEILREASRGPALAIQFIEESRASILVDFKEGSGFAHMSTIPEPNELKIAEELKKMKEAAGVFRGLAATIRATC